MLYKDLQQSSIVLPIDAIALSNIIEELTSSRAMYSTLEYMDSCRYALRTIGALMPADRFNVLEIAKTCDVSPQYIVELTEVLMALDIYEGEINAIVLRSLLGLVDDGVKPITAAKSLGVSIEEYLWLDTYLMLNEHWMRRVIDLAESMVHSNASTSAIADRMGLSKIRAYRLKRSILRRIRLYNAR